MVELFLSCASSMIAWNRMAPVVQGWHPNRDCSKSPCLSDSPFCGRPGRTLRRVPVHHRVLARLHQRARVTRVPGTSDAQSLLGVDGGGKRRPYTLDHKGTGAQVLLRPWVSLFRFGRSDQIILVSRLQYRCHTGLCWRGTADWPRPIWQNLVSPMDGSCQPGVVTCALAARRKNSVAFGGYCCWRIH